MTDLTAKDIAEMSARDLCFLFPLIKNRLGELHLFKSMHSFDDAQRTLGWEVAEQLEKKS